MSRIAVLDFETTGLSPEAGDRATEIAIVLLEQGRVVDRFQSLMNAGVYIPPFITDLTGITNDMVRAAPTAAKVMSEASRFVGTAQVVAHNAAFDRRFWRAELARIRQDAEAPFVCTLLLSRRLHPEVENHRLGTLVEHFGLPSFGAAHRALADAEMAAALFLHMQAQLRERHGVANPHPELLLALQSQARSAVPSWLARQVEALA